MYKSNKVLNKLLKHIFVYNILVIYLRVNIVCVINVHCYKAGDKKSYRSWNLHYTLQQCMMKALYVHVNRNENVVF